MGVVDPIVPPRPRLAEHVLPRRHVIDGEERVVLHDLARDDIVQLGPREWGLLEACDGTRELDGVIVAARRAGVHATVEALRGMMAELVARGMVVAGADPASGRRNVGAKANTGEHGRPNADDATAGGAGEQGRPSASVDATAGGAGEQGRTSAPIGEGEAAARPLVAAGEGLRCDGGGTCCGLYGTIMLSPAEAERARVALPDWTVASLGHDRWTTPMRGSEPGPRLTLIANDGACGLQQADRLCAVHRAAGPSAKPLGCWLYPRTFVDDGEAIIVGLKPECACVLGPQTDDEEPLIEAAWRTEGLPSVVLVDRLPDSIELSAGRWAPRAEVRCWRQQLERSGAPTDVAAALWALGEHVEHSGLEGSSEALRDASPPAVAAVSPWIAALHRRAKTKAREHNAWRSRNDLVRRITQGIALATAVLQQPEALVETMAMRPPLPEHEHRYWQTGWQSYRWVGGGALAAVLRDEAIRVWVSRVLLDAMAPIEPGAEADPDLRSPLALVEAMVRAHGLGAYVDDVMRG